MIHRRPGEQRSEVLDNQRHSSSTPTGGSRHRCRRSTGSNQKVIWELFPLHRPLACATGANPRWDACVSLCVLNRRSILLSPRRTLRANTVDTLKSVQHYYCKSVYRHWSTVCMWQRFSFGSHIVYRHWSTVCMWQRFSFGSLTYWQCERLACYSTLDPQAFTILVGA